MTGKIGLAGALLGALLLGPSTTFARGGGGHSGGSHSSHSSSHSSGTHRRHPAHTGPKNGRSHRSAHAKDEFKKAHPCPSTGRSSGACPGYVIDHVKPLKRGGADRPWNMQWQTTAEAKAKDKWE
jgi:hypothetical protein